MIYRAGAEVHWTLAGALWALRSAGWTVTTPRATALECCVVARKEGTSYTATLAAVNVPNHVKAGRAWRTNPDGMLRARAIQKAAHALVGGPDAL